MIMIVFLSILMFPFVVAMMPTAEQVADGLIMLGALLAAILAVVLAVAVLSRFWWLIIPMGVVMVVIGGEVSRLQAVKRRSDRKVSA